MNFDSAVRRLEKDNRKYGARRSVELSSKARKQAEYARLQQKRRAEERAKEAKRKELQITYMNQCDQLLGVSSLSSAENSLKATSIHGDGDKIALPPSVLQHLSTNHEMTDGSPWTFRIGIRRPEYSFPASNLIQNMNTGAANNSDEMMDDEGYDSDEELSTAAYIDELSHKYLAYTQGSVVEFTQDEGHIGIPASIAAVLINCKDGVPVTRTVDPAGAGGGDGTDEMTDNDETKTPGHLAWGAFDVPDLPIEISLVRLPKGKGCTLVPTVEAVKNGFFNLQDVKLVLEQSLIRTRATLSVGDLVHTWHRGVKFDLTVNDVSPATFNSVLCINTDIEVEFGPVSGSPETQQQETSSSPQSATNSGRRLIDEGGENSTIDTQPVGPVKLPPEPPADRVDGVCNIQIRADGQHGRRRFDIQTNTVSELYVFAGTLVGHNEQFRLVTRFPRRILDTTQASMTLEEAGIASKQELFLVERT